MDRSAYIGLFVSVSVVVLIFAISIPSTKKKGNQTARRSTGAYVPPEQKPLPIQDGKLFRLRSMSTGEYYKSDYLQGGMVQGINNTFVNQAGNFLASILPGYNVVGGFQGGPGGFAPNFQNPTIPVTLFLVPARSFTNDLTIYLAQKYNQPTKPSDLSEATYQRFLNEGWYLVPMAMAVKYPIDLYDKTFLTAREVIYSVGIVKVNSDSDPYNQAGHLDFIYNTPPEAQAAIDHVLEYKNIFRFCRTFSNAFKLEALINPGVFYEVNRHSLIKPTEPLSQDDLVGPLYNNPALKVDPMENKYSAVVVSSSTNDNVRTSFYVEEAFI